MTMNLKSVSDVYKYIKKHDKNGNFRIDKESEPEKYDELSKFMKKADKNDNSFSLKEILLSLRSRFHIKQVNIEMAKRIEQLDPKYSGINTRYNAAWGLSRSADKIDGSAVKHLEKSLNSTYENAPLIRFYIAKALAKMGSAKGINYMKNHLSRKHLAMAVIRIFPNTSFESHVSIILKDAIRTLGKSKSNDITPRTFEKFLDPDIEPNADIRKVALEAIFHMRGKSTIDLLYKAFKLQQKSDEDPIAVRMVIIHMAGRLGKKNAIKFLEEVLADKSIIIESARRKALKYKLENLKK